MKPHDAKPFSAKGEYLVLKVKAFPKSQRNRIDGVRAGELVVRVRAPAARGQANKELVKFLAKTLDVPKAEMRIVAGETSRHKTLHLPASAREFLERVL